jgi:hypothetical protein
MVVAVVLRSSSSAHPMKHNEMINTLKIVEQIDFICSSHYGDTIANIFSFIGGSSSYRISKKKKQVKIYHFSAVAKILTRN